MSSHIGSLLRIFGTMIMLVSYWMIVIGVIYSVLSLLFGFELSLLYFMICFFGVTIFRAFYPKNVFC